MFRKILLLLFMVALVLPFTTSFAQSDENNFEPLLQTDLKVLTGDVQRPNGIFWFEGILFTGCAGDSTIYRIDDETGATTTYIPAVQDVHMLYVEEGPLVWAADFKSGRLVSVRRETGLVPVAEGLAAPWGLVPSPLDDTFYMTLWESGEVINMTREGESHLVANGFENPTGIAVTEDYLFIANNGSARRSVEWLLMGVTSEPQPLITGLQKVTNIVLAPDGYLYIAYALGPRGAVGRVDPQACIEAGGCANVDVQLVIWTELPAPLAGLTISPDMRLFVHTIYGHEIYWLDLPPVEDAS